ncbi:MAG: 4-hydroxybenzoate octaprenyltransferase [Porticoccaceae bacterium]|jgi:4-hydroxybenzoate polyprenyltransferase|nr:4-hydroxybenzoate octaprenyltransferase [Porticoccaceae bacterium]MBT5577904.1 4-hydroxybenzoate octaprenyltransferase [Porticoccaceae bacterium]MBT7375129.1 4-hydroxybenzoate octaprenyltransferase [Porticoccaceae bacterium]
MSTDTIKPVNRWLRLMRLDRPIGTFLLLWPTYWALWLAAEGAPSAANLVIFTAGVLVMRAAGCVINDYADRHVDGAVERTKLRPLPMGEIEAKQALILFFVLLLVALILVLMTNTMTILLSLGGLALAATYPFLKRVTHLPQLGLGAAWAWAVPMAFAAEQEALPPALWLVFAAVILWTVAFDTYYAMVDRQDDLAIGIKSTAILFGQYDLRIIALLQFMALLLLFWAGALFGRGWFYSLGLGAAALYFIGQHLQARTRERDGCFKAFLNNHRVGMVIFIGLALDYQLRVEHVLLLSFLPD